MPDDRRDDELAALLDVEPLDELTRRRLVAHALEHSRSGALPDAAPGAVPKRRGRDSTRLVTVAAALVVLLVVGIAAFTLPRDDQGRRTTDAALGSLEAAGDAAPAPSAPPSARSAPPSLPDSTGALESQAAPERASRGTTTGPADGALSAPDAATDERAPDLGNFGELTRTGARARILAAVEASSWSDAATTSSGAISASGRFGECASRIAAPIVATARGTFDGRPALVAVTRRDDGSARVRVVLTEPCEVRRLR
jgi:hypothetical protein